MSKLPPTLEKGFYYVLSQSWTPALKYHIHYKDRSVKEFCYWTLHGLWLNAAGRKLTDCTYALPEPDFRKNINADTTCAKQLNRVCPSLLPDVSNERHQDHKVERHGVCAIHYTAGSNSSLNGKDYLCTAARLAIEYNIGNYFRGVKLGNTYEIGHLSNVIRNEIGVEPHITSLRDYGTNYLNEVQLFFSPDFKLISKPKSVESNYKPKKLVVYLNCEKNEFAINIQDSSLDDKANSASHSEPTKKTDEASCSLCDQRPS